VNYSPDTSKWETVFLPNQKLNANSNTSGVCLIKKNISIKSNSSSDRSIASESDEELDIDLEKDKLLQGKCFLNFKKSK
jgi:hypothetical protein